MSELYAGRGRSLVVRQRWDGGLEVETSYGGTTTIIALDEFQARDLLLALCPERRFSWPIGPAE